ncbi:MAG: SDR family oxidoreductase [Chloroflexi bacterium]|nr:SDR family oxidoreductase [Chloroflexota bacterium]
MSNQADSHGGTALVVGGGRGLGRATAHELSRRGYVVMVAARTQSEIEHVVSEIRAQGGEASAMRTDATREDEVQQLVDALLAERGHIDVLVNCVGAALIKPTADIALADWERILASNLTSVFLTCRAVMPHMMRRRSGHIVNVSSRVGRDGAPEVAAYTAAKAGVIGFSKALALELKPYEVRVSVVGPSPMNTTMRWQATPQFDRAKVLEPESVAQLIGTLLADPVLTLEEWYPASVRL